MLFIVQTKKLFLIIFWVPVLSVDSQCAVSMAIVNTSHDTKSLRLRYSHLCMCKCVDDMS